MGVTLLSGEVCVLALKSHIKNTYKFVHIELISITNLAFQKRLSFLVCQSAFQFPTCGKENEIYHGN